MKNNITLLIALLIGGFAMAQEESDTTRFRIGKFEFIVVGNDTMNVEKPERDEEGKKSELRYHQDGDLTYWSGFEIGINVPVNNNFQSSFNAEHLQFDPSQSFVFNFNFFEKRIRIVKDYVGLVTGLGFTNSRYGFKNNQLRLASNQDSTFGVIDSSLVGGFTKNQLRVNTFNIPLLLQFNTSKNEDKNFHIAMGVIGGVRIGSNVKYKYEVKGGSAKEKEKGRYNLNAFQALGTVRMGYNDFGVFANYNLLSLFEKDKSEVAYPLSFGVSFHF